jgi:hypothetical protein
VEEQHRLPLAQIVVNRALSAATVGLRGGAVSVFDGLGRAYRDRGRRDRRDATQVKSTPPHASFSSVTRFTHASLSSLCPQKQPVALRKNNILSAATSRWLFGVERDNDSESWAAKPHDAVSGPLGVKMRPPAACAPGPMTRATAIDTALTYAVRGLIVNYPRMISVQLLYAVFYNFGATVSAPPCAAIS